MAKMTSRERLVAAVRGDEVDHVPINLTFWAPIVPRQLRWNNDRERLRTFDILGIDKLIHLNSGHSCSPEVSTRVWRTEDSGSRYPLLHKEHRTPAGPLSAVIQITDDWPWGDDIPLFDDFSPSRYTKPWVESADDVERLRYVLQPISGADRDRAVERSREKRDLAEESGAALVGTCGNGLDVSCWLCGFTNAVLFALEQPEIIRGLQEIETAVALSKIYLLGELGADYVIRRGWYESTDMWSPELYESLARGNFETEVEAAHGCGLPVTYIMCTGIMPLLPQLREIPFDSLTGIEPALGGQDQRDIARQLRPEKSFACGISAPEHLGRSTPEQVRLAVREAFDVYGKRGFTLGCSAGIRPYFPWENVEAMIDEWKRCG